MLEPLKNSLLASLGLAAMAQEKFQGIVKELVDKGDLSREQGGKLMDAFVAKGAEESQDLSSKISGEFQRFLEKTPLVTRQEYQALEARVRQLEGRAGASAPDEVEPLESL